MGGVSAGGGKNVAVFLIRKKKIVIRPCRTVSVFALYQNRYPAVDEAAYFFFDRFRFLFPLCGRNAVKGKVDPAKGAAKEGLRRFANRNTIVVFLLLP